MISKRALLLHTCMYARTHTHARTHACARAGIPTCEWFCMLVPAHLRMALMCLGPFVLPAPLCTEARQTSETPRWNNAAPSSSPLPLAGLSRNVSPGSQTTAGDGGNASALDSHGRPVLLRTESASSGGSNSGVSSGVGVYIMRQNGNSKPADKVEGKDRRLQQRSLSETALRKSGKMACADEKAVTQAVSIKTVEQQVRQGIRCLRWRGSGEPWSLLGQGCS